MEWLTEILRAASKPFKWWIVVAPWEEGVRVRLGKRSKRLRPGAHFRIPYVDRVVRLCVRRRMIDAEARTTTTTDGKPVTIGLAIQYGIRDAQRMIETIARPEETLRARYQAEAARYVAATKYDDLSPRGIEDALRGLDLTAWGFEDVEAYVVTFAGGRVIRLLTANDHGYGSSRDHSLDKDANLND